MLSQGQAAPKAKREKALRSFLRFMAGHGSVPNFPCQGGSTGEDALRVFTDASFAPMKSLGRRPITGVCIFWRQCVLKGFSKTQQAVTLLSCEAVLGAIQRGAQEAVGTLLFVERRLLSEVASLRLVSAASVASEDVSDRVEDFLFGDEDVFTIVAQSDSAAAIALLKGTDLQRRSHHIEIRVEWLRERMLRGHLSLEFAKGSSNPADMFTKCLGSALYHQYRNMLGFGRARRSLCW